MSSSILQQHKHKKMLNQQSKYRDYGEVLEKSKKKEIMTFNEKKKLVQKIDKLEAKDHIGVLKIIMESTKKKIYTVNNYGTYFDLNDLDNQTLWKITYHVGLCLENQVRERDRHNAEKRYLEDRNQFEENLRTKSKLKLTTGFQSSTEKSKANKRNKKEIKCDSEEDELEPENRVGVIEEEEDSEFPITNDLVIDNDMNIADNGPEDVDDYSEGEISE